MKPDNLRGETFSFIYFSRRECSVCHQLLPRIRELAASFPNAAFHHIDLDRDPHYAGEFMIFSIPALLVYSEGKELYRGARFFNFSDLSRKLTRYYSSIFEEDIQPPHQPV